jgi:hypothetical protein
MPTVPCQRTVLMIRLAALRRTAADPNIDPKLALLTSEIAGRHRGGTRRFGPAAEPVITAAHA